MILIPITGGINNGKTTLSNDIRSHFTSARHIESLALISKIAEDLNKLDNPIPAADNLDSINNWLDHLPAILAKQLNLTVQFAEVQISADEFKQSRENYAKLVDYLKQVGIEPDLLRHKINQDNKPAYRPILQWLGGYLIQQVDPVIWFKEIVRQASIASDKGTKMFTACEIRFPEEAKVIKQAGGLIFEIRRPSIETIDRDDFTESQRTLIKRDCLIVNNGTLADLSNCVSLIVHDLASGSLHRRYDCRS